jgi:hypothetical protein
MAKSWAMPTWIFLHTLAAQIPEQRYQLIKEQLLRNIKSLMSVLPCPDCAHHAKEAMAKIELKHVPTKAAFKQVMWKFHNSVNARIGKRLFHELELGIYDKCHLGTVYAIFFNEFTKPVHNSKLMMDVMARNGVMRKFHAWMVSSVMKPLAANP